MCECVCVPALGLGPSAAGVRWFRVGLMKVLGNLGPMLPISPAPIKFLIRDIKQTQPCNLELGLFLYFMHVLPSFIYLCFSFKVGLRWSSHSFDRGRVQPSLFAPNDVGAPFWMLQDPKGCLWDRQPLQLLPQHAQECSFQWPHHFIRLPVYTHFARLGRKVSCTCGI